ncbi:MAG: NAD-dependent epimerase/dehydratase family protein, partial [Betaproteobacteria bacterium]|nr:NAD-dependent epimerase/dehydratase family protein [Betaproteobacteria bacterium]
ILRGEAIDVFNEGRMQRDFTYIDDIAEGTVRVLDRTATPNAAFDAANPDSSSSYAPYRLYNIGNHEPVALMAFIETIERAIGRPARKNMLPMQPGDVAATYADVEDLRQAVGFEPKTPLALGIGAFVRWYEEYYGKA